MSDNDERRPPVPGLRDMRIILPDGTEIPVDRIEPTPDLLRGDGVPADVARKLPESKGEITFAMTPEGAAWLRYHLLVRPLLYVPLEYRLN